MRRASSVVLLLLSSCVFAPPPRPVVDLARFEQTRFRGCTVYLGVTIEELRKECGEPVRKIESADPERECYAYDSIAHSFSTSNRAAPYVIVCTETFGRKKPEQRVTAVYGVSTIGTSTTTEAR